MTIDLSKHTNKNLTALKSSEIISFGQYAAKIPGVVSFTIGEPDFNTPKHIQDAAINAIKNNDSHYAPMRGKEELRQAISSYLTDRYNLNFDPKKEIIVTNGVTEGIYAAITAVTNPGDEVLIPTPTFNIYSADAIINGAKPVEIDTSSNNFKLSPEMLSQELTDHPRAKAVVLVYPSNPSGTNYSPEELQKFADILRDKPIFVLSDEIYSELLYEGQHHSIAEYLPEQTILCNGVSKSYAMTGWRIGYVCAKPDIMNEIYKVHQFIMTALPDVTQDAAAEAIRNGQADIAAMRAQYIKRHDYIKQELTKMGFECTDPEGAFYVWAKIPPFLEQDGKKLIYDLVDRAKVAVSAGSFFGPACDNYLRFSYATSLDKIKKGMKRLARYCDEQKLK